MQKNIQLGISNKTSIGGYILKRRIALLDIMEIQIQITRRCPALTRMANMEKVGNAKYWQE